MVETRFDRLLAAVDAESRRKTDLLLASDAHTFAALRQVSEPPTPVVQPVNADGDEFATWVAREVTYDDPNDIPIPSAN